MLILAGKMATNGMREKSPQRSIHWDEEMTMKRHKVIDQGYQREVVVYAHDPKHAMEVAELVSTKCWEVTHEIGDGWIVEPLAEDESVSAERD